MILSPSLSVKIDNADKWKDSKRQVVVLRSVWLDAEYKSPGKIIVLRSLFKGPVNFVFYFMIHFVMFQITRDWSFSLFFAFILTEHW